MQINNEYRAMLSGEVFQAKLSLIKNSSNACLTDLVDFLVKHPQQEVPSSLTHAVHEYLFHNFIFHLIDITKNNMEELVRGCYFIKFSDPSQLIIFGQNQDAAKVIDIDLDLLYVPVHIINNKEVREACRKFDLKTELMICTPIPVGGSRGFMDIIKICPLNVVDILNDTCVVKDDTCTDNYSHCVPCKTTLCQVHLQAHQCSAIQANANLTILKPDNSKEHLKSTVDRIDGIRVVDLKNPGHKCANCSCGIGGSIKKLFLCSRCKQVYYCDRECQINHWKMEHKSKCRSNK